MSLRAIKRKSWLVLLEAAALMRGEQAEEAAEEAAEEVDMLWLRVVNMWILRPDGLLPCSKTPRQDGHRADDDVLLLLTV